ncbi:unnamed protein product [Oikopleura dioica]|uniref:Uncharacterized protein n=1 Tax=Oikopleura dioica TaxID=34765 RepID=E4YEW1_OIKDI|nr:unnamed protein product [Oikopleura dioica]
MELKQESTVAPLKLEDLNSRRSPSPVRKTAKTAKHAPKTLLDEQIPTDTELKAQERNLAKKKRQMALLEEQLKVEERLRTMRIKKEADKSVSVKKPSTSREKEKNPATTARSKHSKQNLTQKKMTSRVQEKPKDDVLNNSMNISFKQQDTATLLEQLTSLESALKHRQHKLLTK